MPKYFLTEVLDRRDLIRFIVFPDNLYKDCCQYVPALHRNEIFSLTRSAASSCCPHKLWLAMEGNAVVGRICAMINPRYNERYHTRRVRFGWFDCINDAEVADMLIAAAEAWARKEGMTEIHGPLSFNTTGRQGMLIEGYDNIPPFNCLYNFPYYNTLMSGLGFSKECDWVQFKMVANHGVPDKAQRVAKLVEERYNLKIADIDELKKDPSRVRGFFEVYNDSFSDGVYNYIPLTDAEIAEESKSIMPFISDKTSCLLLDGDGEVAAFGISTPSISTALQKARGHLFPFGWFYLLKAMHNYEVTDLMVNGAVPEWKNKGISSVYYREMADRAIKAGNRWAISNPQIETNSAVNIWNSYEHEPYMRRRCYIKNID